MQIHYIYKKLFHSFRSKRMMQFRRIFSVTEETKILDVGGTPYNWQLVNCPAKVTLLNLHELPQLPELSANITYTQGDGRDLQFSDKEFDIVFSNSVIEHLYTFKDQQKFADEMRRVGKELWIQSPAFSFFFEPHFLAPFFHYLPKSMQVKLAAHFTIWGWITHPTQEYIKNKVNETNLLTLSKFNKLFPDCFIEKEKFLGMTKSYIAIRKI